MERSYQTNVPLLAGLEFFAYFGIRSFWLLFLSRNGMSLFQIGILESVFYHGTSILFEIPSGMLADRFSYKANLYIARILSITFSFLMLLAQGNFWIYGLAMAIEALSYNFDSGTSTAMLYESVVLAGDKDRYLSISSFLSGVAEVTRTLGTVVAGLFVHGNLATTYYIAIALSALSLVMIFFMEEPEQKEKSEKPSLSAIVGMVKEEWKLQPSLFVWMGIFQLIGTLMCMFYFYYQKELPDLQGWQISSLMLIGSGVNLLAVYLASRLGKRWGIAQLFPVLTGLTGVSLLFVTFKTPFVFLGIYLVTNALYAFYQPIFYNDLQEQLPSPVRATLLSVNSMLFSLSMIVVFPLTGWLLDQFDFVLSFLGFGVCLILLSFLLPLILKSLNKKMKEATPSV